MSKKSMCVVSVGGCFYLLPVRDGTQLIELMAKAEAVAPDYSKKRGASWRLEPEPTLSRVSIDLVAPEEVDRKPVPPKAPAKPVGGAS